MNLVPDYSDVSQLLFKGFLSVSALIKGIPVVFKTVNSNEIESIPDFIPINEESLEKKGIVVFIALSIYRFNYVNVLEDREEFLLDVIDLLMEVPLPFLRKIHYRLIVLNERATKALEKIQPYFYGPESQYKWSVCKNIPLNDSRLTGIKGTENLGLNLHQMIWVSLNQNEDLHNDFEILWENTKFLASVHEPKQVKEYNAQDRQKKKDERDRRMSVYMGQSDGTTLTRGNTTYITNESVEDLNRQLNMAMSGELDLHDLIIRDHIKKAQEAFQHEAKKALEKAKEARKRNEELLENFNHTSSLVFYNEQEVQKIIEEDNRARKELLDSGNYLQMSENLSRARKGGGNLFDDAYEKIEEDMYQYSPNPLDNEN